MNSPIQHRQPRTTRWVALLSPIAAIVVCATTSSVHAAIGVANIALVLGLITVAAALADWRSGAVTSVTAALSLNFFHTQPLRSFRVTGGSDITTIGVLLVLGLAVSSATARRVRTRVLAAQSLAYEAAAGHTTVDPDARVPAARLWLDAVGSLSPELALLDATLTRSGQRTVPTVGRSAVARSAIDPTQDLVVLPATGASVRFLDPRITFELLLVPHEGVGPLTLERSVILRLADDVETAVRKGRL